MEELNQWEELIYGIMNYFPYIPFVCYPFLDSLRFEKKKTWMILLFFGILQIVGHYGISHGIWAPLGLALTSGTSIGVLFLIIKGNAGKLVMTLVMVQNIAILLRYMSEYIDRLLFYRGGQVVNVWTECLCLLLLQLPVLWLLWRFLQRVYIPAIRKNHSRKIWGFIWMVPMTFFMIWESFISRYADYVSASLENRTFIMLMLLIISLGSFVIYYITILLLTEENKTENYSIQFKSLKSRIQDARRARHDVRHHLIMIRAYYEEGKYEELKDYLKKYEGSMSLDDALVYCEHFATNALFTYFVQQAKAKHIRYSVEVNYPEQLPISEEDLTVVFGNLLENALHACQVDLEEDPNFQPEIQVRGKFDGEILSFAVSNSSKKVAKMDAEGRFISSKHEGNGIGLESVRHIVERHSGKMQVNQENGKFIVSLMMQS